MIRDVKLILATMALLLAASLAHAQQKPNILVIWGDDVGWNNPSMNNRGMMGYRTPNIDRIAAEGMLFTDCQGGELNAVRWNDWKISFAMIKGNIAMGERVVTNWPLITHLRADPYETMWEEGEMGYMRWFADQMWLFVPVQAKLKEFFMTIPNYPFQEGSSLSAGGINYNSLKAMKAMKMLEELDQRFPVGR